MPEIYDLRVYYGAPSLVRADARWRTLASNIADFRPDRTWRIAAVRSLGIQTTDPARNQVRDDSRGQTENKATGIQTTPSGSLKRPRLKRKAELCHDNGSSQQAKRTNTISSARAKRDVNSAFPNPLMTYLSVRKTADTTLCTVISTKAPARTIQIPRTKSPKKQVSRPDYISEPRVDEILLSSDPSSPSRIGVTSFGLSEGSPRATQTLAFAEKNVGSLIFQTQCIPEDLLVPPSQPPLCGNTMSKGSDSIGISNRKRFPASSQDRFTVATSLPLPTESPTWDAGSQLESSPLAQRSTAATVDFIDLTDRGVTEDVATGDDVRLVSTPTMNILSSPLRYEPSTVSDKILALPRRLFCCGSCTQYRNFQSFVPQALRDLAKKCRLTNKFRPEEAVESIRNGDRGYWRMLIRMTGLTTVAKSRRSPLSSSQWSDRKFMWAIHAPTSTADPTESKTAEEAMRQAYYPNKDASLHTPWTVDEFIRFWTLMRKTIERGRAGCDVHATIGGDLTVHDQGLDLEVRFYGYSEALSHMWCILYVYSNKVVANMPVQWMKPGRGMLIKMTGQPKRGGSIGRWIERNPGIGGCWGLEEVVEDRTGL